MPLPTVLGLLLKKDKPTWTMEKTWAGRVPSRFLPLLLLQLLANLHPSPQQQGDREKGLLSLQRYPLEQNSAWEQSAPTSCMEARINYIISPNAPNLSFILIRTFSRPPMIPEQ